MTIDLSISRFNFRIDVLQPDGSDNFNNLLQAVAEGPSPHLVNLCLTGPAAWFWLLTRDLMKKYMFATTLRVGRAGVERRVCRGLGAGRLVGRPA